MVCYLEWEASFAPISFELQRQLNWWHSIIWVTVWVAILVLKRARSELTRNKCKKDRKWEGKGVNETPYPKHSVIYEKVFPGFPGLVHCTLALYIMRTGARPIIIQNLEAS